MSNRNASLLVVVLVLAGTVHAATTVSGELKQWHKVTLTFDGPSTSETATPNPFTDYRLKVTFTNGGTTYVVPGYYCADGNAANSGASSGSKWRVHFAPDKTGTWSYSASFRTGSNVAVSDDVNAGSSAGYMDGATGTIGIAASDKTGRDLRAKGRLSYVGGRYLRFAGNGEYLLKQGADSPENLFAYADFDGNFKSDGISDNYIKTWSAHVADWKTGDPTWMGGKGKGLIGAINYLAAEGMNVFSFLTMNINGDDKNVFPYTTYSERYRLDCSRLDQWEIVLDHGNNVGMYLHFKTQETENELLLDGGNLGNQRKLYYRELIARFGHHLALNWNLGEEINDATTSQKQAWAQYFYDHDPYRHHIVIHNGSNHYDLLGSASKVTGFSLQTHPDSVHGSTKTYLDKSIAAGKPWVVAWDETNPADVGVKPDSSDYWNNGVRKGLYGHLLAGGAGCEYYFGYSYPHSDLTCQDFRSRNHWWDQARFALQFFKDNGIPFWEMTGNDGLTSNTGDYCLAKSGEVYVIYLPSGGTTNLDLGTVSATFSVQWFDPRNGGGLLNGSVTQIAGPGSKAIGNAPNSTTSDWAVLVKRTGIVTTYQLTVDNGTGDGNYAQGAVVSIAANAPATGKTFDKWTGSVSTVANIYAASTTLTMPAANITVTATYKDAPTGLAVTGFTLINADTDTDIGPLANNATLNLATLPTRNLNVRAEVSGTVVSVKFGYDGNASYKIESAAPFALAGDTSGNYNAWTPTLGAHTLTATPYSATGATGTAGTALTIGFSVVDQAGNTAPVIDSAPWADPNPVTLPNGTTLNVMALDDGLPNPPSALTYTWSKVTGPGTVTFGAGNGTTGTYSCPANFSAAGEYLLRVTVSDSALSATDTVTVTVQPATSSAYRVNSGGAAIEPFAADAYVSGGSTYTSTATIDISGVTNPAPAAVYRSERYGNFTYTFTGLQAGANYTARLHFAEIYFADTGKRVFNVSINGTQVLANFDIVSVTGAKNKALVREFAATANASGQLVIQYASVVNNAKSSGIEILGGAVPPPPPPPNEAPSVSLAAPVSGATFTAPASITVSANASDSDGNVTKVEFYAGTIKIGEDTSAPYSIVWSNVAAGSYTLTAKATDDDGATKTSSAVSITVNPVAVLSVTLTDDAYLENGTRKNDTYLKVQNASPARISYLRFSVTGLSGAPQSATLALRVAGDPGSGTLRAYAGSHSNWTETTLTSTNAPAKGTALGTFTGTMALNQTISLDVKSLLTGEGAVTVILEMDAGGNDGWFSSKEGSVKPVLTVQP